MRPFLLLLHFFGARLRPRVGGRGVTDGIDALPLKVGCALRKRWHRTPPGLGLRVKPPAGNDSPASSRSKHVSVRETIGFVCRSSSSAERTRCAFTPAGSGAELLLRSTISVARPR